MVTRFIVNGQHVNKHYITNVVCKIRDVQTPGARPPGRLNFVPWRQIFLGPQYGTCVTSPLWRLEFLVGSWFMENVRTTLQNVCAPLQDVCAPLQNVCAPLQDVCAPLQDVCAPLQSVCTPRTECVQMYRLCVRLYVLRVHLYRMCVHPYRKCAPVHIVCSHPT
jgi:hypothetical protein